MTLMKAATQNWLDNPRLSHVQACCTRSRAGEFHIQTAGPEIANEQVERAMKSIAALVPQLLKQGLLPGRIIWDFTNGRLYYVARADGSALGLFCKPGGQAESSAVEEFIAEFAQQG
jgi:hypothetical protein